MGVKQYSESGRVLRELYADPLVISCQGTGGTLPARWADPQRFF